MTKGALLLGRIGLVLFAIAFISSIVFDFIAKDSGSMLALEKLIWALFGFVLGSRVYGRRAGK